MLNNEQVTERFVNVFVCLCVCECALVCVRECMLCVYVRSSNLLLFCM